MPLDTDVLKLYWTDKSCNADLETLQQALTNFTSVYYLDLLGRKAIQISAEPAPPQVLLRIFPMKDTEIAAVRLRENLPTWKERYLERKIVFTGATEESVFFYSDNFVYEIRLGKYTEIIPP